MVFFSPEHMAIFSPNAWQIIAFLNPLDVLIPQILFAFPPEFRVGVCSGPRSQSRSDFGALSIEPVWGRGGGASQSPPPPPPRGDESPPTPFTHAHTGKVSKLTHLEA